MKTTPIPAQVTTVEDKIAGNLSMSQLMLMLAPLFISVFVFAVLPQRMYFSLYKTIIILFSFVIFFTLCLRIKERIILTWLILLISYYFRPHIFVFDKNDLYLREEDALPEKKKQNRAEGTNIKKESKKRTGLPVAKLMKLEKVINARNTRVVVKFARKRRLTLNRY